jgi:7-carboxy-7-deazaguanine synthase
MAGLMASYAVKEAFLTLQGEGMQAGRRAVFVRFAGCNLWSGREEDRADAMCSFCDTDFVGLDGDGGGRFGDADGLAAHARALWDRDLGEPAEGFVVLTGGEPLLQVDEALVAALKRQGFRIAIETNGTQPAPAGIDWICVSPKAGTEIVLRAGNELKLVWPQAGIDPVAMEGWAFDHFLISPMDCAERHKSEAEAIRFVMGHPRWRLSTQTHKMLGIR